MKSWAFDLIYHFLAVLIDKLGGNIEGVETTNARPRDPECHAAVHHCCADLWQKHVS